MLQNGQTVNPNDPQFREWMKGVLHNESIKDLCVTFTKIDGTERKMFCTLSESRIPADKQPKTTGVEEEANSQTNGSAVRVFDVEKQEWRSFRWDSITNVNFSIQEEKNPQTVESVVNDQL